MSSLKRTSEKKGRETERKDWMKAAAIDYIDWAKT
jgi:hypothetical protein